MQSAALLVVRPSRNFPEYESRYVDLRVEDHPSPIDELERVFRIHQASDLLRAHVRYAEEFEQAGDLDAAAAEHARMGSALEYTLSQKDAPASTLNALAWYCGTGGVFLEQALTAAQRAASLEPENTGVLDTLAEVLFRLGQREQAIETIQRALQLSPGDEYLNGQLERFMGESNP
jgi:tetratricopeptide (TPR) repeat protein